MSGGGGSSGPSTSTNVTTNIPDYAKPYVMKMFGQADALASTPYQAYTGERVAGPSALQQQAYGDIAKMGVAPQIGQGTSMTADAAMRSGQFANSNNNFYNPQTMQVGTQDYTGANVDKYMSPYMNDVVNQQKIAATADYGRSLPNQQANAAAMGALGGSRANLVNTENQRNLQQQLQGIQATGSQAAFQNAQQQFNAQQQANLQAQMANQQAGLTNANQAAQWGLAGKQLGLQGLAQQMQGGAQMGQLGMDQYNQMAGIINARNQLGQQQQQNQQARDTASINAFNEAKMYPYNQMQFLSEMFRGTSPNTQTQLYQAPPNTLGQVGGLAMGLGSLFSGGFGG